MISIVSKIVGDTVDFTSDVDSVDKGNRGNKE
jgi:hypothetical protein